MKKVLTYVHLFFSFLIADEGSFEKGVIFYDARSEGAIGYNVKNSAWGGGNKFAISLIKEAKLK